MTIHRLGVVRWLKQGMAGVSMRAYARSIGCSVGYLNDVLKGRKDPGPKLLKVFGLEKAPKSPQRYRRVSL